jgi:hypothetical protein
MLLHQAPLALVAREDLELLVEAVAVVIMAVAVALGRAQVGVRLSPLQHLHHLYHTRKATAQQVAQYRLPTSMHQCQHHLQPLKQRPPTPILQLISLSLFHRM